MLFEFSFLLVAESCLTLERLLLLTLVAVLNAGLHAALGAFGKGSALGGREFGGRVANLDVVDAGTGVLDQVLLLAV